ncbi:unnamed protein product, partial [Trichogramma brassicae]
MDAASCDRCSSVTACAAASTTRSPRTNNNSVGDGDVDNDRNSNNENSGNSSVGFGPTMRPWTSTSWQTRSRVRPAAPLRIVGAEKAWTPKTMSRPPRFPSYHSHTHNVHQNAEAPASPDPAVNRGFAVDRLPVQADVNAWLRRIELQQPAPIEMTPEPSDGVEGRTQSPRQNGAVEATESAVSRG